MSYDMACMIDNPVLSLLLPSVVTEMICGDICIHSQHKTKFFLSHVKNFLCDFGQTVLFVSLACTCCSAAENDVSIVFFKEDVNLPKQMMGRGMPAYFVLVICNLYNILSQCLPDKWVVCQKHRTVKTSHDLICSLL